MGALVCAAPTAYFVDHAAADLRTLWYGEKQDTLLKIGATALGANSEMYDKVDFAVQLSAGSAYIMRPGQIASTPSNKSWNVSTGGLRNELSLTEAQSAEAVAYAKSLGVPDEAIHVSENMNTSYKVLFGEEKLYIGTDVLPATGTALKANSRISLKGTIAHEVVGHRAAELAGKTQSTLVLEEAQASIRAARFAPELSSTERTTLIRDAIERLQKSGQKIKDVKDQLWINSP